MGKPEYGSSIQLNHFLGKEIRVSDFVSKDGDNKHMKSIRVEAHTNGMPQECWDEQGLLMFVDDMYSGAGGGRNIPGTQIFMGLNSGKMYTRRWSGSPSQSFDQQFTEWTAFNNRASGDNWIGKPEIENTIQDANSLQYSGIFRTIDKTSNLPSELTEGTDKWGILQHYYENLGSQPSSSKTGFQLFAPIDGKGFGNLYIRVFNRERPLSGNSTWAKLNIENIISNQDKVFTHPTEIASDIDNKSSNSYHVTTTNTLGTFPTYFNSEEVSKHGIIKTMVTPAGNLLQQYTPLEGESAGLLFTRTSQLTTRTNGDASAIWQEWSQSSQPGKVQIHTSSRDQDITPLEYAQHASKNVIYEVRFGNTVGLPEHEGVVILQTMVAQGSDLQGGFMYQIAYPENKNQVFVREYKVPSQGEPPQGAKWGDWKELTSGGASSPIDVPSEMKKEFEKWVTQAGQSEEVRDAFKAYHDKTLQQMFESWKEHTSSGKAQDQTKFEAYADTRYSKANFASWTTFDDKN